MTKEPDWADKIADDIFWCDYGPRDKVARALRDAEKAGMERAAEIALNKAREWMQTPERFGQADGAVLVERSIRAAKETKE